MLLFNLDNSILKDLDGLEINLGSARRILSKEVLTKGAKNYHHLAPAIAIKKTDEGCSLVTNARFKKVSTQWEAKHPINNFQNSLVAKIKSEGKLKTSLEILKGIQEPFIYLGDIKNKHEILQSIFLFNKAYEEINTVAA